MPRGRLLAAAFGAINILMGLTLFWFGLAFFSIVEERPADSRIRATVALVMGAGYIVSGAFLVAGWRTGKLLTILVALPSLLVLVPMGVGTVNEPGWSWDRLIPFGLAAYWIAGCVVVVRSRSMSSTQA